MQVTFKMLDKETGELLAHKSQNLVCNFENKNDVAFKSLLAWASSCVRGIKDKGMNAVELCVLFIADKDTEKIDF